MSITLPVVDLSSAVVGTSGAIPLQSSGLVAVPSQQPPYLQIYNDSGAGLLITLKVSQLQFYLSAKGHILAAINNAETEVAYSVQNISTNIQTNQLWVVYYYPGENVPDFSALGTSTVSQQATTLVNVGNPVGTTIIFSEPLGDSSPSGAINITNSGLIEAGDTTNSGKIVVSGTHVSLAATNNIFPDQIQILGTGSQFINLVVSGTDAFFEMKNQANTSQVKLQTNTPVHLVGTTAGSIDMYQDFTGDVKRVILVFNGYRNATATPQVMAIPVPFIKGAQLMIGNINCTMACLAGGVAQNINHYANGVQTVATSVTAGNTAECATAFDSVSFVNSGASPTTCIVTLLGS